MTWHADPACTTRRSPVALPLRRRRQRRLGTRSGVHHTPVAGCCPQADARLSAPAAQPQRRALLQPSVPLSHRPSWPPVAVSRRCRRDLLRNRQARAVSATGRPAPARRSSRGSAADAAAGPLRPWRGHRDLPDALFRGAAPWLFRW